MVIIVTAKGLRYTMHLFDDEISIKENANFLENAGNLIKKINIFKKEKVLLIDETHKLDNIKEAFFESPTQDTSLLVLELVDGSTKKYEMSPTDKKFSNALKTQVKQIADYIQSKK